MNTIWGFMILIGLAYGMLTGRVDAVSDAVLSSAKEAVTLCVTMLGVMALWVGIMEIAQEAGLVQKLCRKAKPLIRFLFPQIPEGHPAGEHITMNCVANFLGLGWAATPAGLKAMESLAELEEERRKKETAENVRRLMPEQKADVYKENRVKDRKSAVKKKSVRAMLPGVASSEMCTFLIINISSLQLIPVNVIAYRTQYGSVNPTAIVGPGIVATAVSTAVAVVFCKVVEGRKKNNNDFLK